MSQAIHPLFDNQSYYRLATRMSLWRDGGDASVRSFFLTRMHQDQRQCWLSPGLQTTSADWGYDDATNAEVSAFVTARKSLQKKLSQKSFDISLNLAAATGEGTGLGQLKPSLLIADPIGEPFTLVQEPADAFTGIGAHPLGHIDAFKLNVGDLSPKRRAIALILDRHLIKDLAERLGRDHPANESQVIEAISAALEHKTMTSSEDDAACRRAFGVSTTLALAPGLERITTVEGHFDCEVGLSRPCPGLNYQTWIVVCVSPSQA